jgi:DNA-binding MarR family transcriptional regulator
MDNITEDEIRCLDKVWHELIVSMQKTGAELWGGRLESMSTIEISILSIIEIKPDVILKEIIESLGVPASTLTNAIDRLEKRGLIRVSSVSGTGARSGWS